MNPGAVGVLLLVGAAALQEPPQFPSEVRVVELDVHVTHDNRPVLGLAAADFQVRDAGVLQRIEVVEPSRSRVNAILLLDTSSSVAGGKLQQLRAAADAFVRCLGAEDSVTVLSFAYRVHRLGELAGSPTTATLSLRRLASGGTTALVDAVAAATAVADPRRGRPILLIFSDGDDRVSWLPERNVLEIVRRADIVIHGVSFTPSNAASHDRPSPVPRQELRLEGSPGFLDQLARATGGRSWYADAPEQLAAAFLAVLGDVRERYLIRYEPAGVPEGGFHAVEVGVARRGHVVRCRPGYWAGTVR